MSKTNKNKTKTKQQYKKTTPPKKNPKQNKTETLFVVHRAVQSSELRRALIRECMHALLKTARILLTFC